MRSIVLLVYLILLSCQTPGGESNAGATPSDSVVVGKQPRPRQNLGWQAYTNRNYHFSLQIPNQWKVAENTPGELLHAVNLYSPEHESEIRLPLSIHSKANISHLSFYPVGWATEFPSGESISFQDYKGVDPVNFSVNYQGSYVFLLKNGQVWGYFIKPNFPLKGWAEEGYIFAQVAVEDFKAECFDKSGQPKPIENCDPLGDDHVIRSGRLKELDDYIIREALQTLHFISPDSDLRSISDWIAVNEPQPQDTVSSPLKISGRARGSWYFEGSFPVVLQDENYNHLAKGVAQAAGDWMTVDFVPFELMLDFQAPQGKRGYVLFQRSNASGMAEQDRFYRLPVYFE